METRRIIIGVLSLLYFIAPAIANTGNEISTKAVGTLRIECADNGVWNLSTSITEVGGKETIELKYTNNSTAVLPFTELSFRIPQEDMLYLWRSGDDMPYLGPDWGGDYSSSLASNMPLYTFLDANNRNRLTVSVSDVKRRVEARMGLREEECLIIGNIRLFTEPEAAVEPGTYTISIQLDKRDCLWSDAVQEAAAWITDKACTKPCRVPDAALEPLYSTWYNFHQNVFAKDIEEECRLAKALGMNTIIVDDGWQTDDNNRGYAYCGDWEVSKNRFPDFRAHIDRVHAMGMKYMLWYSVPYMGEKSKNYERFADKCLYFDGGARAGVLDPRFPEVRQFLIEMYEKAMLEWGLDGFKLDFIDSFGFRGEDPAIRDNYAGRDIKSLPEAIDQLMKDVYARLSAINPDVLIEFRQSYIGPAIRQYGNMLRSGDCPGNPQSNRTHVARLRLTSGETSVHSDMLEWNLVETPENVACNILSGIFGVIQYSAMLREIPDTHKQVISTWLDFSQKHRETLLLSNFRAYHPECGYPMMEVFSNEERILCVYLDSNVAEVDNDRTSYILNATGKDSVVVDLKNKAKNVTLVTCTGERKVIKGLKAGVQRLAIPAGGYAEIK